MGTGNHLRFRRQTLTTWAAVSAACMIVASLSPQAGLIFVGGWVVIMELAIYIFSTRTFKLSSDRYFLFIGSFMPGIVVLEILYVLTQPSLDLVSDVSGSIHQVLGIASAGLVAIVLALAPRLARLRVHRYIWSSISICCATVSSSLIMFTGLVPHGDQAPWYFATVRAAFQGAILLMFAGAMVWLVLVLKRGRQGGRGMPDRVGTRFMIGATGLLALAQIPEILACYGYHWHVVIGYLLEGAGLFLIVDGLIYRGLEVPVRLITRSRAQLEAGISAAADGLLIHDLSGRVIAMNWRFRSVLGPGAEILCPVGESPVADASRLLDIVVRDVVSSDSLRRRMQQFLSSPATEGFERVELRDGRVFEVYSIPYNFEGRIDGRVWSLRDVSARERTTAQLERSNWRLDNILTSAGDGLFEINLERGTLWLHSNWMNVVGCDSRSVPVTWDDFRAMIHPDDLAAVNRALRQPFSRREFRVDFRMPDRDANWRWYLCVGRMERIESGFGRAEWVLSGVQRDVTAEKTQEVEIRRQRGLMEALIENMPLGAFVKEATSGRYVIWNSALANLTGLPASHVIGRTDDEVMPADTARRALKSDEDVINQGVSVVIENSWLGESAARNIRLRKVPVIDADRTVKLIIGIVEDVTQQQQVDRLVHQARSLEALGRLAGGIAHDFNNILQVIIGAADSLKLAQGAQPRLADDVDQILEAGERARTLIRQLLTFSRQDSSSREPVDVDALISGLLKMLQRLIGADIAVGVKSCGVRLMVAAERSRLEQVFMNLTVNAVDAMPYGGSLTIGTSRVDVDAAATAGHPRCQLGPYAMVSVSDSGIGIPRDVLDHMWEPFYSTKDVGKGTGLGLSTVYGIVDSLGGFVQVHSEVGHGTEFKVFLPLCATAPASASDGGSVVRRASADPGTILVAHGDASAAQGEAAALQKCGYRVVVATSGPEALQRLLEADDNGGVRLMIVDLVMAGIGGRDIVDRYRSDHLEVPVIFCAEVAAPMIDEDYLKYVNGRLLRVPYSRRQLMLAVRALLPR